MHPGLRRSLALAPPPRLGSETRTPLPHALDDDDRLVVHRLLAALPADDGVANAGEYLGRGLLLAAVDHLGDALEIEDLARLVVRGLEDAVAEHEELSAGGQLHGRR